MDVDLDDRDVGAEREGGSLRLDDLAEISFDTAYLEGSCSSRSQKTLRIGSNRVYSDGTTVSRCLRTSRGRFVKASAHGPLAPTALAVLVVSARPVR